MSKAAKMVLAIKAKTILWQGFNQRKFGGIRRYGKRCRLRKIKQHLAKGRPLSPTVARLYYTSSFSMVGVL
jgi:hypothetical protein